MSAIKITFDVIMKHIAFLGVLDHIIVTYGHQRAPEVCYNSASYNVLTLNVDVLFFVYVD
jgi:hypothetical protein